MSETSSNDGAGVIPLIQLTTEQVMVEILPWIRSLKVIVGTLAAKNTKRVEEIAAIGQKAGSKGEIETDYEGILTPDKRDASDNIQNLPDTKPEQQGREKVTQRATKTTPVNQHASVEENPWEQKGWNKKET